MRRGTIVAGLTVGIIGVGGASAVAASIPITVDVTGGTVKAGSLAQAPSTGTGLFTGTIDTTTFAATFPAAGNALPSVTVPAGAVPGISSAVTIARSPGAFTGQGTASASGISLNLSGNIAYTFTSGNDVCTGTSILPATAATPTFTGAPIDLATGAYSAAGTSPAPTVMPATPTSLAFCTTLNVQLALPNPLASIASSITGKVSIPGLVPLPSVAVIPGTTTPTTPTTPVTPTPAVKAGKLAVSVSKPKTVKRGKSTVSKVTVRNTGAGSAKSVTVKLAASGKGVTPRSTTKTYTSIAAGKSRTFSVRLKTKKTSAKSSAVKVTVKGASGLSASKSTTLRLR